MDPSEVQGIAGAIYLAQESKSAGASGTEVVIGILTLLAFIVGLVLGWLRRESTNRCLARSIASLNAAMAWAFGIAGVTLSVCMLLFGKGEEKLAFLIILPTTMLIVVIYFGCIALFCDIRESCAKMAADE